MEVPTYLATRLEFEGMGESTTEFRFEENEAGVTTVTWTFDGEAGSFFGRWVTRFMDDWIGPDYETGLANLKALAEAAPTIPMEVMNSEAINYFGIRYASDLSDLLADEILEYRKVKAALAEDSANIEGNPFVYFEAFAGLVSVADYIVALPYSGSLEKEGFVKGMLPSRKVLKVTHTGHPTQLDGVLDAVKAHMQKHSYSTNGNVWMEYVNSGPNIPLEEWVQHIYFPIMENTELQ